MTRNTFTQKNVSTTFAVQNIAPNRKDIKIFGQKIGWNRSYDLLTIPDISEADIRHSLLKGELKQKADAGEILVTNSTIDLTQYDGEQRAYLAAIGITTGLANALVTEEQIYYVGKHGADTNDGLTLERPFLTFGAAVAAATAQTPTSSNRFVIKSFDSGIYNENIELTSFVDLHAPSVTVQGGIELKADTTVKIKRLEIDDTMGAFLNIGVLRRPPGSGGPARFEADSVVATGTADAAVNGAGAAIMIYEVKSTFTENGVGIGDGSTSGHIHIQCEDIYVTGTGKALLKAGTGSLVGYVAHILELGGGVGNGTGIDITGTGEIDLQTTLLEMTTAYSIAAGGTLRLMVNKLTGATVGPGTAYVTAAGYTAANPADWGGAAPTTIKDALDRIAAAAGPIA